VEPKKIEKAVHGLDVVAFDLDALNVIRKLRDAGFSAYFVGGCIRDLLLKHAPKDFDISTSAKPEDIKRIFRNCILIGRRFRLAHLRFTQGKVLEVSTFRSGDNEADTLITRDNLWGSEEEDVMRRDFTINGLFFDSETEMIIDYVDGYKDLQDHCLKTIGPPFVRFKQDPVRMIRCLKFQARFGLIVDEDTKQALIECRKEIVKSSQARILEELLRMLESGASKEFFHLMTKFGLLEILLPTLAHFLEHKEGQEIYDFLDEADLLLKEPHTPLLSRAVLLSSMVFPLLNQHLTAHIQKKERSLHLGQVQKEAALIIDQIFQPFFILPKRIKGSMVSLLTTQYRLTPLENKAPGKIRIPRTPDFSLALDFLKLRARLEPALKVVLDAWSEVFRNLPDEPAPRRHPTFRRRRPTKPHEPL
jgi:poly(A) polymerase